MNETRGDVSVEREQDLKKFNETCTTLSRRLPYVPPAILTMKVKPAYAKYPSETKAEPH